MSTQTTMAMDADYWRARCQAHGHTGWADAFIYAFDQQERLRLMEHTLDALQLTPARALDFGCGTGDFSKLLLKKGWSVTGYDPFVQPSVDHPQFQHVGKLDDLRREEGSFRLVVSVTVLDHILDTAELQENLAVLRASLGAGGQLLLVEYALDSTDPGTPAANNYQSFRNLTAWLQFLQAAGFEVLNIRPIPHPVISPSRAYLEYAASVPVKILRRLSRFSIMANPMKAVLKWQARSCLGRHLETPNPHQHTGSPLKLICCRTIP